MDELVIQSAQNSVTFRFGGENYAVYPHGAIIAIADKSDRVSFKLLASRKTIFSYPFDKITPSDSTASETVELLNTLL